MQISLKTWTRYKDRLAAIDDKAVEEMQTYLQNIGGYSDHPAEVIRYAYALSNKYGEAAAAAACEMYEAVAEASGVKIPSAEPAELPDYKEVARAVGGTAKNSSEQQIPNTVGRLVKRTGADTTLKNAQRDGAEYAWIPAGDTCAFCLSLAANGWQHVSKDTLKNGHADHIHPNCDCAYAIRFDSKTNVAGYNPEKYKEMFENAEGDTYDEKINSIRRMQYQNPATRAKINAQDRAAYAKRTESLEMYRKGQNPGAFSVYEEPMTKKHVKQVAQEMGLDPRETKYIIEAKEEMIGRGVYGHTSEDGKTTTLYPDAFINREQLVKTLGHEHIHLIQAKEHGIVDSTEDMLLREVEAYSSEPKWWKDYVERTGYGR